VKPWIIQGFNQGLAIIGTGIDRTRAAMDGTGITRVGAIPSKSIAHIASVLCIRGLFPYKAFIYMHLRGIKPGKMARKWQETLKS